MIVSLRIKSYNRKKITYQIHHDLRLQIPDYVDKTRLNKNAYYSLIRDKEIKTKQDIENYIFEEFERVKENFKKHNNRKLRADTGIIIEGIITFSKDSREFVNDEQNWKKLDEKAKEFVRELERKWNTKAIYAVRHSDETTTHYHFAVMNYDYENHRTIRAVLKKKDTSQLQDLVANVFKDLGFERGKKLAQRLREEGELANVRNWGGVSQIHQKMLEEIAEMQEKQKELQQKIAKYERLAQKKEEKIKQLQSSENKMIEKIEKHKKTLLTYLSRIEKARQELSELEKKKKELEKLQKEIEEKRKQKQQEEEELKKILQSKKFIELLERLKNIEEVLEFLYERKIIDLEMKNRLERIFNVEQVKKEKQMLSDEEFKQALENVMNELKQSRRRKRK